MFFDNIADLLKSLTWEIFDTTLSVVFDDSIWPISVFACEKAVAPTVNGVIFVHSCQSTPDSSWKCGGPDLTF